jgi:uncharacterized protein YndB with AHSA1/START domain
MDLKDETRAPEPIPATLVVRRRIEATAEKLFEAWTDPSHLLRWWGPRGVECIAAEVDLRAGGAWRIANRMPDGTVLWIAGSFEHVEPPHRLIYSWQLESRPGPVERVTVCFEVRGTATEVIVTHERMVDAATRTSHEAGWNGCLESLAAYSSPERSGNCDEW